MAAYVEVLLHDHFREGSCKFIWINLRLEPVGKITTEGLSSLSCLVSVSTVSQTEIARVRRHNDRQP